MPDNNLVDLFVAGDNITISYGVQNQIKYDLVGAQNVFLNNYTVCFKEDFNYFPIK